MFLLGKLLFCQDEGSRKVITLPVRGTKVETVRLQSDLSVTKYRIKYRVFVNNKQIFETNVPLLR